MKKIALLAFVLVLLSTAIVVRFIRPVEAGGTIYISSDYTFTSNIYEPIVVTADNIIIDGAGYTVQGNGSGTGIKLSDRNNVTLKNVEVTNFGTGIYLYDSSYIIIAGNTVSNNSNGIFIRVSYKIILSGNTFSNNNVGIYLRGSITHVLSGNTVSNSNIGIYLYNTKENVFFHNNLINNTRQVYDFSWDDPQVFPSVNTWDDGYPSGGNYWSDHICTGNPSDGSQPYVIDADNVDHYPFQDPTGWLTSDTTPPAIIVLSPQNTTYTTSSVPLTFTTSEPVFWMGYNLDGQLNRFMSANTTLIGLSDGSHTIVVCATDTAGNTGASSTVYFTVDTASPNIIGISQFPFKNNVLPEDEVKVNATVTDYVSGVKQVTLNYTNGNGTWITVNMTNLVGNVWNATIPAFPYGTNVTYTIIAEDNMNNTITTEDLGYEYQYTVIPEFPSWTSMLLLLILLTVAIAIYKRRLLKTPTH